MNARRGFWIYLLLVTYLCLFPWQFDPELDKPMYSWPAESRRATFVDVVMNLGLLFPFGVLGRLAFSGRRGIALVCLGAAAWTLSVEALQTMLPGRTSSVIDLMTNFTGALAGLWAAPLIASHLMHHEEVSRRIRVDARALFLLACFLVGEVFPFIPNLRVTQIRSLSAALPAEAGWMEILTGCVAGLLVTMLLRRLTSPAMPAVAAFAAAFGLLVARVVFPHGVHPGIAMLAEISGALLGAILPARMLQRHLWAPLLGYLVLRQLSPFSFVSQASEFSWQPFAQLMDLSRATATRILFEKVCVYGAILFALYHRTGSWIFAMLPCIAVLALGEWAQRWIPGRTPDSLDPLLVVLVTLTLALLPGLPWSPRERASHDGYPG